jgi:hypothetical protein
VGEWKWAGVDPFLGEKEKGDGREGISNEKMEPVSVQQ